MSFVDEKIVSLIKNLSIFSFSFFRFYYINFGFVFTIIFYHHASTRAHLYDTTAIEIQISNGRIRGEYGSLDGENYVVFRGIPYAAPPVGAARFQQPAEPANWRGVMNATSFRSCLQNKERKRDVFVQITKHTKIAEDCLFLNVFAPPKMENYTYPVMVWIHGGGFQVGSAADYPQNPILRNFVSRKVIFVTFNYRLGPFGAPTVKYTIYGIIGFASTGDSQLPGNYGLWDQIEALKWVQKNIAAFGGDITSVTLVGQGSGAASASILALSPRADGLFHRVILLSGTAISPGIVRESSINATWALDNHLKCRSENSSKVLKCLREDRPAHQLLDPNRPHTFFDDYFEWVPVVDGYGGVIPESPERLVTYRPRVPMIIGTTKDETALHFLIVGRENMNMSMLTVDQSENMVRNLTAEYAGFTNHHLITEGCFYEYIHSRNDPAADTEVLKDGLLNLYSHFWYHAPASRLSTYYEESKIPVYLYSFDHAVETSDKSKWAFHGADLKFLFDMDVDKMLPQYTDKNWQNDKRVTEVFSQLLTNFAKYNDPTPPWSGLTNWTRFRSDELNYYSITDSPSMQVGFHWRGHVFWNNYARKLDAVDIGNLDFIQALKEELYQYKLATFILLGCAALFFAILVGLGCYCTRKDAEEDEL